MKKQNDVTEIDVLKLLRAMWRRIWLIIVLSILGAAIAFSYANFYITPTYQASALMYVNASTGAVVGQMKMTLSDLSASSNLVDYYIVILKSRTTLEEVITEADLDYSYGRLNAMVSASPVEETGIFRITVTSTNPEEAQKIANTITYVLPEKIEEIMEGTSARVVEYAVVPTSKSAPNITRYTAIGLLLGAVLGAGIITIGELMDDIVHGGDELSDSYSIPVLAEIPDLLDAKAYGKYGKYSKYGKYGKYSKYSKYGYSKYGYSKYGKYAKYGKYDKYSAYDTNAKENDK